MASAPEQVSETVELLEMILLMLSPKDILLAQRVSKLWKGLISNSKKLQEAIFMNSVEVSVDPQHFYRNAIGEKLYATPSGHFVKKYTFFNNPLIDSFLEALHRHSKSKSFLSLLPTAWNNQDASWRRMKLMHPPTEITAIYYKAFQGNTTTPVATKSMNTGKMDLGELAEWLEWTYATSASRTKTVWLVLGGTSIELDLLHELENYSELAELKHEMADIDAHKNN